MIQLKKMSAGDVREVWGDLKALRTHCKNEDGSQWRIEGREVILILLTNFLYDRHYPSGLFTNNQVIIFIATLYVDHIFLSILYMKTQKPTEIKWPMEGHMAGKSKPQNIYPQSPCCWQWVNDASLS